MADTGPDNDVVVAIDATCAGVRESATGRVVSAGERAAVLSGKRVLVGALAPCGDCETCRRGGASACPLAKRHSFGDHLATSGRWLVALDDGLELPLPAAAAVAGDVAVAYTLYARTGIGPRDPVVITGMTAVTRFVVEIILAKAGTPVVVVDPDAPRHWLDWLLAKGVTTARVDRAAIIAAFAAQDVPAKPWSVIATGDLDRAATLAGPRATLTVLAPVTALPGELVQREVTVIAVADAHPDLVVEAAAMCVKGEIDLAAGTTTTAGDPTRSLVSASPAR
jgi:threonine dehydrogenase-like Zn-dependent dehydrogenase